MIPASYITTMQEKDFTILDFESAVALAIKDPAAFEEYRCKVIDVLIARAPEENRLQLQRLQWRTKQVTRSSPNRFEACVKLQQMMWHSLPERDQRIKSSPDMNSQPSKSRTIELSLEDEQG